LRSIKIVLDGVLILVMVETRLFQSARSPLIDIILIETFLLIINHRNYLKEKKHFGIVIALNGTKIIIAKKLLNTAQQKQIKQSNKFMGFFSKKVKTDTIAESLLGFFDIGYGSLVLGFKDSFKDKKIVIDAEKDKELLVVPMFAIIRAVMSAFGDTPQGKNIIGKFQHDIFNKYFKDAEEKNQFGELFWKRCDEYSKILNPDNKDIAIQFGQIFCNHFFGKEEDGSNLDIMMFVGSSFLNLMVETKKFLDEILSKTEVT